MRRETLIFMLLSIPLLALTAQNQYFVSLKGNDRQCGSAEKPFGTIERALAEARKSQGETTVFLREGTYRLTRPIVFTHLDGGEGKPLTLRHIRANRLSLRADKCWKRTGRLMNIRL